MSQQKLNLPISLASADLPVAPVGTRHVLLRQRRCQTTEPLVGDDFRTSTRPQSTKPNFRKSISLLDPGPFNGSDDEFVRTGGGC
nr:hypothetical protein [Tanacetum cinerariifolium]